VAARRWLRPVERRRGRQNVECSLKREDTYRPLAEQATAAQTETAAALADLRPRIAAIEKLIRDVGE